MNLKLLALFIFCTAAFGAFAQNLPKEVDVAVPSRDIARGAKITEDDLTYAPVAASRAGGNVVRSIDAAAGKEARRALRAGELIRDSDLKRPVLVAKGSTVTMVFETPGIRLTAVGRALSEGAAGDAISVLNPTSYRQVEATVIAPGTVSVNRAGYNPVSKLAAGTRP
jgi:flagellar basal body P-ring formation protein FlgA